MNIKLERLIQDLTENTYVMLKPSSIHGIGVFAIRDIPQGCRDMFISSKIDNEQWITVPKNRIISLPSYSKDLIENYCLYDDENYFIPEFGFKKMDLVSFLNHSENPNIISIDDGEFFEAIREIKNGEELMIDYGEIVADSE